MKRTVSSVSPVLVLALAGLWLLLNQTLSIASVVLGTVLAIILAGFATTLRPLRARLRRMDIAFLLLLVVLKDVVHSNLSVARIVLRPGRGAALHSAFLRIPLDLRDPHGLAALAAIVTATPGTVWSGLSADGDVLTLHVLDLKDAGTLTQLIKRRYERPLMRIFE